MKDLALQSGVPASTIKHYLREGLLPEPEVRTSKNMAYYNADIIPRIKLIKQLQKTRYLPLQTIKQLLDGVVAPEKDDSFLTGLTVALHNVDLSQEEASQEQLIADGMKKEEFEWLKDRGLLNPVRGKGKKTIYSGDDLALCRTLSRARQAGLRADMLPHTIIEPYVEALTELLQTELQMFRTGVMSRADQDSQALIQAATALSESLILILRRKLLVPVLKSVLESNQKD